MALEVIGNPARSKGTCVSAEDRVTRSLLGWGAVAGPLYVTVSLAQALTREGFQLSRHSWSTLANGSWGWLQTVNLILTGLMVTAFAVGLHRAVNGGIGARWIPRLIGVYGISLVAAGVFRADPAAGFPVGTPETGAAMSWHGTLHLAAAAVGFGCFAAAAILIGLRQRSAGRRTRATLSWATASLFLITFAAMVGSAGAGPSTIAFAVAVVVSWGWVTAVAIDFYREVGGTMVPAAGSDDHTPDTR